MMTTMHPYKLVNQDQEAPESLADLCFKFVVNHLETICTIDPFTKDYKLREGLTLPCEICEKLLQVYQQSGNCVDDRFINIFQNYLATPLKRVRLRNSTITDDGLCMLLNHHLVELDLSYCGNLTEGSLVHINEVGDYLLSLSIGGFVQILPDSLYPEKRSIDAITNGTDVETVISSYERRGYILRTFNLRRLAVRALYVPGEKSYFPVLLRPLKKLTHLDLSSCEDLGQLDYLTEMTNLVSLVLYNVHRIQEMLPFICRIKTLRHLDISQSSERHGKFTRENQTLALIVESLPFLESLDISGTNLAGTGVAIRGSCGSMSDVEKPALTDIPGLWSRVGRPLEFLGLYYTQHGACMRQHIPAKRISGEAGERQILTAAAAYLDRPDVLQKVLNDLYHLFRYESCQDLSLALSLVLAAMDRHLSERHIQISGSATLFYIVKGRDRQLFAMQVKRQIVFTLLNGMIAHRDDDTMMRNGCLTLCQFKIPQDVLFDYQRLVGILLHIVSDMEQEGFVQRIGIYLLNSLACQVDGAQKQLLGDLGAITRMLALIEDRLARKVCDDVLEVAWSTMWNVTDETAINCQRFLDGHGMDLFLGCLEVFPEKEELLRNMMGLLGNVAEVRYLRPRLMTEQFVQVFADLLDSCSDGIEVSYNAAGVLSHMASDGAEMWTIEYPKRADVLLRMVVAVERWDLGTERNINYRSFEPILYLVGVYHTPECQHWAVWALANLTEVYPNKYCQLVIDEGGVQLLQALLLHEAPYPRIKELASRVLSKCQEKVPDHVLLAPQQHQL